MRLPPDTSRLWPVLLILAGMSLVYRAIVLFVADAPAVWAPWTTGLYVVEVLFIVATLVAAAAWAIAPGPARIRTTLRLTAGLIVVHALRVAVFVLGRTGPWVDFDVLPEARAAHADTWTWAGVWFAAIMATLSLGVLVAVWHLRRRRRNTSGMTRFQTSI